MTNKPALRKIQIDLVPNQDRSRWAVSSPDLGKYLNHAPTESEARDAAKADLADLVVEPYEIEFIVRD